MSGLCLLMRMALARGTEPRDQIRSIFLLSVKQKQDHWFATHTKQRTLSKLFGLHGFCILVSKFERSNTTSFTGFASVVPVRMERTETSTTNHFTPKISQHCVKQSPASNAVPKILRVIVDLLHGKS